MASRDVESTVLNEHERFAVTLDSTYLRSSTCLNPVPEDQYTRMDRMFSSQLCATPQIRMQVAEDLKVLGYRRLHNHKRSYLRYISCSISHRSVMEVGQGLTQVRVLRTTGHISRRACSSSNFSTLRRRMAMLKFWQDCRIVGVSGLD